MRIIEHEVLFSRLEMCPFSAHPLLRSNGRFVVWHVDDDIGQREIKLIVQYNPAVVAAAAGCLDT